MFPQHLWPEIYGDGHFISALRSSRRARSCSGPTVTWRLSGTYDYCSGIPYSTHFSSQAVAIDKDGKKIVLVTFLAKREDWIMLDNWGDMLGMKGAGSQSVTFDNALIPDRFVLRKEVLSFTPGTRSPASLDHEALGLGDYGRPGNYFERQIGRWARQYRDDPEAGHDANMDWVIAWLEEKTPEDDDETRIIHGDFRIDKAELPGRRGAATGDRLTISEKTSTPIS